MIRKYLFLLLAVFFVSCAGTNKKAASQPDIIFEGEVTQTSVVDTSFKHSDLYQQFGRIRTEGPLVPGLRQALVPQGMAYWAETDTMVISNYMSDGSAGVLTLVGMDAGTLVKSLFLYNADETPHTGHLGGLAVSRDYLWIASGPGVYFIMLEKIKTAENRAKIFMPELVETETKGSFATFSDGVLWLGEFTRANGSYPVLKTHHSTARDNNSHRGWLGGYKLDSETDMIARVDKPSSRLIPDFIISIPDEIQGAVFFNENILLSASYGRRNSSRLLVYKTPLPEPPHRLQELPSYKDIPFWFLDDINKLEEITLPPMSEALVEYKNSIAVLFESAAFKYRSTAAFPVDRIQFLPFSAAF